MFSQLRKWNTLRNQILIIFILVMVIVLLIVSLTTLNQVSSLLKNNAEKQIQQVAIEANGRFDSLYEQINMASKLVITNTGVQELLTKQFDGKEITFADRQKLMTFTNIITANSDGVFSFQLFANNQNRLLPLDEENLLNRIDKSWIEEADKAKGRLVWVGQDPNDKNIFLALRRVNLMERQYHNGGYLLISIYREHFQFTNKDLTDETNQYSILLNHDNQPIVSNFHGDINAIINSEQSSVQLKEKDYMVTKQSSKITGWTVLLLTPVSALTDGITGIRTGIILSGIAGLIIFTISSFFLSTVITSPIVKLTKTMQRAGDGSLPSNPSTTSVYEVNELNSTYNQLVKETNHLIQMVYQKEILRNRSELKALQAQINPHFLFNTLDALHWSLEEKNEEELSERVLAMSDLFRYTITKETDDEWVFIKDEMKHIEDYMDIMEMRFGDRLLCRIDVPQEYQFVRIPKLIIQPLVENAILHGAGNKLGQCQISVAVEKADEQTIMISVKDDGPGMDEGKLTSILKTMKTGEALPINGSGKGMAISNVYKRLKLYYQENRDTELSITSEIQRGTQISFVIPKDGGE